MELYGDGVTSISGKFDRVQVPDGWRYELHYDYVKPAVVIRNFRPNRAPAFPSAEGFGKFALGGRGGKVMAVTSLNDDGFGDGDANEATLRVSRPFGAAPVNTQTAAEALDLVLQHAGASLRRDAVDSRIIEEIRRGTAHFGGTWKGGGKGIIDSQSEVGGWPNLESGPAPADGDGDGIPDAWEIDHQLNPANPDDGSQDQDHDGYTNIEAEKVSGTFLLPSAVNSDHGKTTKRCRSQRGS